MGVVANMAPELFLGIIADVPFVDVLNTMLDESLPLTPPEWPEWGNPIASKEDFEIIRSYSPYDNVAAKAYPHIFAYAGLTDPRVTYWEPAKWIARLRAPQHQRQPDPAQDQHGGRPRRRLGPLRGAEGAGARLRLRAEDHGQGRRLGKAARGRAGRRSAPRRSPGRRTAQGSHSRRTPPHSLDCRRRLAVAIEAVVVASVILVVGLFQFPVLRQILLLVVGVPVPVLLRMRLRS